MSENYHILWADDEIDLLKPHLMFLSNRGYQVTTANNGRDALELVESQPFDLIVLDENMPGLTGLETLSLIKQKFPLLPVIMITKSEEENIMDQAVGNKNRRLPYKAGEPQSDTDCNQKDTALRPPCVGADHPRLPRGI